MGLLLAGLSAVAGSGMGAVRPPSVGTERNLTHMLTAYACQNRRGRGPAAGGPERGDGERHGRREQRRGGRRAGHAAAGRGAGGPHAGALVLDALHRACLVMLCQN